MLILGHDAAIMFDATSISPVSKAAITSFIVAISSALSHICVTNEAITSFIVEGLLKVIQSIVVAPSQLTVLDVGDDEEPIAWFMLKITSFKGDVPTIILGILDNGEPSYLITNDVGIP